MEYKKKKKRREGGRGEMSSFLSLSNISFGITS